MKKQKIKNLIKIGILTFGIAFIFANCQTETNNLESENTALQNKRIKTVSFDEAKKFFNSNKNKNSKLFSKGNNVLELIPQWETIDQTALYQIDNAKLTLADVKVNRKGKYTSELFFLNINDEIKNVIFTIYPKNVSRNGTITDATIYLNETSGLFIDGYIIEGGKFVKRIIATSKPKTQKASFLSFFQDDEESSDCWNTDGGGFTFEPVYLYGTNGGFQGSNNTYSIISSWNNNIGSNNHSNTSYSSGGGGSSFSSVAASIYTGFVETEEGVSEVNEVMLAKEIEINNLLQIDPYALIKINCTQIPNWTTIAQHSAPQIVKDKIKALDGDFFNDFEIQTLNGANGTMVNLDYFVVNVTSLPTNTATGQKFTADELLNHIRTNINNFVDGSSFEPYCKITSMCQTETNLWNSNNPLGAIVYIDIPFDDGVVVLTKYKHDYWYFQTMNAPFAGNHPVSGTRQFGYEILPNGSFNFFVRGVDRFDSNLIENVSYGLDGFDNAFEGADNLWKSYQTKLKLFVDTNGGNSSIKTPIKNRPDWDEVKDVLEGKKPISQLGCN